MGVKGPVLGKDSIHPFGAVTLLLTSLGPGLLICKIWAATAHARPSPEHS